MGQVGIKGPFEIPYAEGTWVTVLNAFVVVGAVNVYTRYKIIGNVLFFHVDIHGVAGGDTSACTAGVSNIDLPLDHLPFWNSAACWAADVGTDLSFGAGIIRGTVASPPTWAATHRVIVSGYYFLG